LSSCSNGSVGMAKTFTSPQDIWGISFTEAFVARGSKVTALSLYNSFDGIGWLEDPEETRCKLKLVRGDIRDAAFVWRIVKHQEIVFHLAALIAIPQSYTMPQACVETNVRGALNVLEAARESGTGRVVHTSTSEVYGTAINTPIAESHPLRGQSPSSASKIGADTMAEAFARSFDLPVVILRPFNTFGPRQSERAIIPTIVRQALDPARPAILVGDPTPLRDLTFVSDTVAAFLAMGTVRVIEFGRAYNSDSGKAVTVGDLIGLIMKATECDKPVQDPQRLRPRNSEVRALLANSSCLRAKTGRKPEISLSVGLERTISWWRRRLDGGLVRREEASSSDARFRNHGAA
jgi:nucleoside-diphosphate-sugar epimerase